MCNDASRAYFNAAATRDIYVELPIEDPEYSKDLLGKLNVCLYGKRDAAANWGHTLSAHLLSLGFGAGRAFPPVFVRKQMGIVTLVHGDGYFSAGDVDALRWHDGERGVRFEVKTQLLGPAGDPEGGLEDDEILNSVVRWCDAGIEYKGGPRHGEVIVRQLGLEPQKPVGTPGLDWKDGDVDEDQEVELTEVESSIYIG